MKYICYALLGLLLSALGYGAVQRVKVEIAQGRVESLTAANEHLSASLVSLSRGVDTSNRLTMALDGKLDKISNQHADVSQRVITLERTDEKIRDFLSIRLPANGCLLDNSCTAGAGVRSASSIVDAPLQAAANRTGGGSTRSGEQFQ